MQSYHLLEDLQVKNLYGFLIAHKVEYDNANYYEMVKYNRFHNKVLNPAKNSLGPQIPETAFSDRMTTAIRQVAKAQEEAAISSKNFELGLENDLSKVMMKQQISSLGFQLTLNVRNKVLSSYKDIMNMPV